MLLYLLCGACVRACVRACVCARACVRVRVRAGVAILGRIIVRANSIYNCMELNNRNEGNLKTMVFS